MSVGGFNYLTRVRVERAAPGPTVAGGAIVSGIGTGGTKVVISIATLNN